MKSRRNIRVELGRFLHARSAAAAAKALSGISIEDDIREIEQVDKLIHFVPDTNKKILYAAGIVGATCLIVACVLWTVRLPTAHLQFNATSKSLMMTLAKDLSWSGDWDLSGGLVRMEDMSEIELPPELARSNLLSGRAWIEMKTGDISLKHLEAKSGAQISFQKSDASVLDISARYSPLLGQLEISGKPTVEAGASPEGNTKLTEEVKFEIPGTITFFHQASPTPALIRTTPKGTMAVSDLHLQGISFAQETNLDSTFISGITKGTLTVLQTGERRPLEQGDRLRLDGVKGIASRLTIGADGAEITFEGTVRSVLTGPQGFERELKPSLLDYFYHQQRLGFFWAAASFLWGLLWSARMLIFK